MKKFFTVAVVVLMASLSFGAAENFYTLSEEEMQREFAKMTVSQWAETINTAFETQNDRVIGMVLRATARTLNTFDKLKSLEMGNELNLNCPRIMIHMKDIETRENEILLVLWDSYKDEVFYFPVEYKTSPFTGKMPSLCKDAIK